MKILDAFLLTSAHTMKQLPEARLCEFALVGRSNVGKSSFINALLQRRIARTSNTPGKTRLINFYVVRAQLEEQPLEFTMVDLPGYGYAKMSKADKAHWSSVLEQFLRDRETLTRVVHLVDIRHGFLENDWEMHEWLVHRRIPSWVVLTKSDKLSRSQAGKQILATQKSLTAGVEQLFSFSTTSAGGDSLGGQPAGRDAFLSRLAQLVRQPE